jgi:hypothetical protein
MDDGVFEVECPCCGATLEIDADSGRVLGHRKAARPSSPEDLGEAVKRLRAQENTRDERFRKQVEAERAHGQSLEKRFDGLLKKARNEGPAERGLRDIDLD